MKTTFVVDALHRVSGRPWVFLTGRLLEGSLDKGDTVTVSTEGKPESSTQITTVEFHARPGAISIAVPESAAGLIAVGSTLTRE